VAYSKGYAFLVNSERIPMVYICTNFILNKLYPSICIRCGIASDLPLNLCRGCLADLPHNPHACRLCALPLPRDHEGHRLCGACQATPSPFDTGFSPFLYQGPVRRMVSTFKFNGQLSHGRLLGQLLAQELEAAEIPLPELLIPVPLHKSRLQERGFNQALELCRPISRRRGIPIDYRSCVRSKPTLHQADLNMNERKKNLRGAFGMKRPITAKHVALVDDVITTGSTLRALAVLLKHHGVERVDVWSVARTP